MHGKVMRPNLPLQPSFVFDTSAYLPFPPAAIRRCLLATVDMTVLVGSDGHRATIQFGDPATSH
jgi:hypothetical protein